jgi:hypothetical protein
MKGAELLIIIFPFTSNLKSEVGLVVPIPTLPFAKTVIKVVVEVPALVEAIANNGVLLGVVAELEIERIEYGEVVPMPTLPADETYKVEVAVQAEFW